MYNFDLKKEEKVIDNFDDVCIKTGNDILCVSVLITNLRLLFFDYPKDVNPFKFGRSTNVPASKEEILEVKLADIKNIKKVKDFYKYTLNDDKYFMLSGENTYRIVSKNINK